MTLNIKNILFMLYAHYILFCEHIVYVLFSINTNFLPILRKEYTGVNMGSVVGWDCEL